jgi:Protein of unknown function (DUF3016)
MKANVRWLMLLVLGATLSSAYAAGRNNIRIDFVQPENFSDFRIQDRDERASAPIFADKISYYLAPMVARRFPGATLSLRFTDIYLAGELRPWRGPRVHDIRFAVNMRYPLRLYFDYNLVDSRGHVLASGSKSIVDADYVQRYVIFNYGTRSTLFYEEMELRDWVNRLEAAPPSSLAKSSAEK